MHATIRRYALVLLWCGVIFWFSSQQSLPSATVTWVDYLVKKAGHITVYAVLFVLTQYALEGKRHRILIAALFCLLYAISDEVHQSFVPGRTPMVTDVGYDMIGASFAYICIYIREHYGRKRRKTDS